VSGGRLVAQGSWAKFSLVAAAGVVAVGVGLWLIVHADSAPRHNPVYFKLIGGACVVFFAALLVNLSMVMLTPGPVLEIGPDGLMWRIWSRETIPWSAFDRTTVRKTFLRSFVTLSLKQPTSYAPSVLWASVAWIGALYGSRGITVSSNITDCDFGPILYALRVQAPGLFGNGKP
jgi:hypothetical protein